MKRLRFFPLCLALLAPATGSSDFSRLWTGWNSVNREAMTTERQGIEQVRRDVASADSARLRALRDQGRALGERVGEIVRLGDCEEGERIAREAGDFALVEAVRDHCRRAAAAE
jgi:hypothetical protein